MDICRRITLSCLLSLIWSSLTDSKTRRTFNVVGLFEPSGYNSSIQEDLEASTIFQWAVGYVRHEMLLQSLNVSLEGYVFNVTNRDGFLLSQYVCGDALKNIQIAASLGVKSSGLKEYMQIVSDTKEIPYFELTPSEDYSRDMVIQMHPDPSHLVDLVKSLIKSDHDDWNWKQVFIVYESTTALTNYLELLAMNTKDGVTVSSYHIDSKVDYTETFNYIRKVKVHQIVVDCELASVPQFLNKALEKQMLTSDYHYHFTSLDLHVLNLTHFSYGGAKITWSQLVNRTSQYSMSPGVKNYEAFLRVKGKPQPPSHYFTTHNALIVDAITILAKSLRAEIRNDQNFAMKSIDCNEDNDKWSDGRPLRNKIHQRTEPKGMTGMVQFLSNGKRVNYTMMVMRLLPDGQIEAIGVYKPATSGDRTRGAIGNLSLRDRNETKTQTSTTLDFKRKRPYRVTTVIEEPYLMKKVNHDGDDLHGNELYEGYIADLMERIAIEAKENHKIDFQYQLHEVGDKEYGTEIDQKKGIWNGMIGEIMDEKADMAAAPLTINYEREQVVDFTKPFMTLGIAILYKLPEKEPPHMLSFMEPINIQVWGTIILSVMVVSFSMYIFSRFSPTEWENPFPCQESYEYLENQFNLSNAFWFSVGSIMQQGCDIMPKAPSTRIIAISWWLFTLIIISSYTANLAAFLTITTLSDTFKSADELAGQTIIPYGCKEGGNTCAFFSKSKIEVYKTMWNHMVQENSLTRTTEQGIERVKEGKYAYLMESSSIQYQTNNDPDCELTQVGPPLNSLSYGIGLPNKSPLRDTLSSIILRLNERQVLLELYNKWWKVNDNKCKLKENEGTNPQLQLNNLEGIFVFLVGGLGIACVVLCIEILAYSINRSKAEKVSACALLVQWLKNSVKGTFPNSPPSSSIDRGSISSQGNHPQNSIKANIKHSIIEEETEPLNGHTDKVPCSLTTDTLLPH